MTNSHTKGVEDGMDELCNCGHTAEYHSGGYGDCMTGSGCDCRGFDSEPIRSATPEELTAQRESYGKNYKPGPRQATPFMPEELPHMQGNETNAVSDLLNSMKVIDRHQRYQECRSDVLTKLMYELAALRENKPTLPVPERTAEMEHPASMTPYIKDLASWIAGDHASQLEPLILDWLKARQLYLVPFLDHIEGKPK